MSHAVPIRPLPAILPPMLPHDLTEGLPPDKKLNLEVTTDGG